MADSLAEIKLSFRSPVFFPAFISNSLRCQVLHRGHIRDQKLLPLWVSKKETKDKIAVRKNSSPLWAVRWREVFVGKYIHNQVMSPDCSPWAADGLPGVRRWERREWVFGLFVILVADGNNWKQKVWERNSTFWKNVWPLFWPLSGNGTTERTTTPLLQPVVPRFVPCKMRVTATLCRLHWRWLLLCVPNFPWPAHISCGHLTENLKQMAGIEKVREYNLYWSKPDLSSPSTFTKLLSFCKMWTWNAILKHRRNLFLELSPYVEHCCFMRNVWGPAVSSHWLWNYKSQSQQGWWKLCNGNMITKDTGWEGTYAFSLSQLLVILPWLSLTVVSRWDSDFRAISSFLPGST